MAFLRGILDPKLTCHRLAGITTATLAITMFSTEGLTRERSYKSASKPIAITTAIFSIINHIARIAGKGFKSILSDILLCDQGRNENIWR